MSLSRLAFAPECNTLNSVCLCWPRHSQGRHWALSLASRLTSFKITADLQERRSFPLRVWSRCWPAGQRCVPAGRERRGSPGSSGEAACRCESRRVKHKQGMTVSGRKEAARRKRRTVRALALLLLLPLPLRLVNIFTQCHLVAVVWHSGMTMHIWIMIILFGNVRNEWIKYPQQRHKV